MERLRTFNRLGASELAPPGKIPTTGLIKGVPQMRRVILFLVSALALVLAAPATSATVTVSIKRAGFAPKTVNINQDDSVTWTNHDTINHQVVANNGSYASPILGPGKSWTRKFASGGTSHYHDSLHPSLTGTVVVKGAPPQISLMASAPVVKYGAPVMLSGVVSNKKSGETVTLVQLPFGQTTKQVIATLQTTTGGAFSYSVTPQVNTTYQAQWPGKSESSVTVQVQPAIKLPFVSKSGFFHFYVTAGTSFAGKAVFLQRYTLARTWVNIRTLTLGPKSGRLISVRFVRSLIPRGRWSIRVFMPATEMGGGYLDSWSGTQPVVKK
jgi:plastocyanin